MSKVFNIAGQDYTVEFTIEASLHKECIEKTISLIGGLSDIKDDASVKAVISQMADIPQTALTMFYAGLLENHGNDGDGSVPDMRTAKILAKTYFKENADKEDANFYGLLQDLLTVMESDGFFKQIGLEQSVKEMQTENAQPNRAQRRANAKGGEK